MFLALMCVLSLLKLIAKVLDLSSKLVLSFTRSSNAFAITDIPLTPVEMRIKREFSLLSLSTSLVKDFLSSSASDNCSLSLFISTCDFLCSDASALRSYNEY